MTQAGLFAMQRWCPWCGDHMGWFGWGMMIVWWLLILAVVVAVFWALRRGGAGRSAGTGRDPAEDALREQFARGEIDEETYRRRLDELRRA
ncbi:MAG TPA: hypothetical protein VFZ69_07445 [Longimicrobiales bacterium]